VASVQAALAAANLPAARLCLEVTESSMMRASGTETAALEGLRRLRVRLAIDGFGTGYPSLAYLHQLPGDELTIDRSFINRIAPGNCDAHLVEAIMALRTPSGWRSSPEESRPPSSSSSSSAGGCQQAQASYSPNPCPPP
jgi:EAL domain-containing protein (putative c-di-GMP-specific phosphodiesterase class I)